MLKYWKWAVFVLSVLTASLVLFDFGMSLGTTCPFHQPISAIETASQSTPKHCSIEKSASYGAIRSFVEFIEHGEHFFVAFGHSYLYRCSGIRDCVPHDCYQSLVEGR
jgi:hypothetical protein